MARRTVEQRFWAKVTKRPGKGCWIWTGAVTKDGYAVFRDENGKLVYAYRWLFEHQGGTFPPKHEWDHKCETRACVRGSHGEPVTHAENMRRVGVRRRLRAAA